MTTYKLIFGNVCKDFTTKTLSLDDSFFEITKLVVRNSEFWNKSGIWHAESLGANLFLKRKIRTF